MGLRQRVQVPVHAATRGAGASCHAWRSGPQVLRQVALHPLLRTAGEAPFAVAPAAVRAPTQLA